MIDRLFFQEGMKINPQELGDRNIVLSSSCMSCEVNKFQRWTTYGNRKLASQEKTSISERKYVARYSLAYLFYEFRLQYHHVLQREGYLAITQMWSYNISFKNIHTSHFFQPLLTWSMNWRKAKSTHCQKMLEAFWKSRENIIYGLLAA